jgi:hypothetical protein
MNSTLIGLFKNMQDAEAAVHELQKEGFSRDQIGMVAADRSKDEATPDIGPIEGIGAEGRPGKGAAIGGAAGFVGGLLALAIPGIGPAIAAGPIAAALGGVALGGAAIGAATGGLIGLLKERGVSEEEAEYFHEGIIRGGVLVSVYTTKDQADSAKEILEKHHPVDIDEEAATWRAAGWSASAMHREPEPIGVVGVSREEGGMPKFLKQELDRKHERRPVRHYLDVR